MLAVRLLHRVGAASVKDLLPYVTPLVCNMASSVSETDVGNIFGGKATTSSSEYWDAQSHLRSCTATCMCLQTYCSHIISRVWTVGHCANYACVIKPSASVLQVDVRCSRTSLNRPFMVVPSIGSSRQVVPLENIKDHPVPLFSQFWLWKKSIDLGERSICGEDQSGWFYRISNFEHLPDKVFFLPRRSED